MKIDINPASSRIESEVFSDLYDLCRSPGYIHAIAYFSWRDNLIRFSGERITEADVQHQYSQEQLLRTEISTLIGLMARGAIDVTVPKPETLQNYIDQTENLLHEMHMSLQKPWMEAFQKLARNPKKSKGLDPFNSAEGLREPIFYGGESAYNFQYIEFSKFKYQLDNDWLENNFGFSIYDACIIAEAIGVVQSRNIISIREKALDINPDQWSFLPGFSFLVEEITSETGIKSDRVEKFINAFCFKPETQNGLFLSLSDFNEANAYPIIKLDNSYVLLQHYSLLEALYEGPFFWMVADKSYRAKASKNRGLFAERFLMERLGLVFGAQHVFTNVDIYRGKDRVAEADVLVLYGDQLIILQAKSKRLTIEARKGNDLQLKDDFKKAIHDAYDQCLSCAGAILDSNYKFVLADGNEIHFPKKPKKIFPLCVVSDHYPALAAQARQFLRVRASKIIQRPVITDVFFIDVATEILRSPLHLLNYFALRSKFDEKLLVSQELTILGYHLRQNLWLEDKYSLVNLADDFISSIDIAMTSRRLGMPGDQTPKGILTRFEGTPIGRLLSEIEASASPELVGLGMLFLQFGSETAKYINIGISKFVKVAAQDGLHHDFSLPAEAEKSGITIHINSLTEEDAHERLLLHCQVRKYDTKSDSWYGLLLFPESGHIRSALVIDEKWKFDQEMEKTLHAWPKKPMMPLSALSSKAQKSKVGRNELCSCGSGKKYKKCCLNR